MCERDKKRMGENAHLNFFAGTFEFHDERDGGRLSLLENLKTSRHARNADIFASNAGL
jgi:hypothetical protein